MAESTSIEWTAGPDGRPGATWNIITGCSLESPGCTNCYAMRLAGTRLKHIPSRAGLTQETKAGPVWNGTVRFNEGWLDQPRRWTRGRNIFVCAHGDLFHENVPDEWLDRVFREMGISPQHTFQVLTKRASRMRSYMTSKRAYLAYNSARLEPNVWPPRDVWLGVSVEDQTRADQRLSDLAATPAAIRFFSAEPLLTRIETPFLSMHMDQHGNWRTGGAIHWVIAGGESGPGARPMHPDWVRSLRDQCQFAGVPLFFKQWGAWWPQECNPFPDQRFAERLRVADIKPSITAPERGCWDARGQWMPGKVAGGPPAYTMWRIGKKAAGATLDGREWREFPAR